jgi:hypothetical protein
MNRFVGVDGGTGTQPTSPVEVCADCGKIAAFHTWSSRAGYLCSPADVAGAGGRLTEVMAVSRKLIDQYGSPLPLERDGLTVGAPTIAPLSRRYKAMMERKAREQREAAERQDKENEARVRAKVRAAFEEEQRRRALRAEKFDAGVQWIMPGEMQRETTKPPKAPPVAARRRYFDEG